LVDKSDRRREENPDWAGRRRKNYNNKILKGKRKKT
jgi:hypothetical protein